MPIFKDFSENGELLQTRDEPLNAENFDRYVKENGTERAQGYLDALLDLTKQIDKCYINFTVPGDTTGLDRYTIIPNSHVVFQRKILLLQEQKTEFLMLANSTLTKIKGTDNPSPSNS